MDRFQVRVIVRYTVRVRVRSSFSVKDSVATSSAASRMDLNGGKKGLRKTEK